MHDSDKGDTISRWMSMREQGFGGYDVLYVVLGTGHQVNADTDENREIPLPAYLAYLCKNLRNWIRDDYDVPVHYIGKFRQGKDWYPSICSGKSPAVLSR